MASSHPGVERWFARGLLAGEKCPARLHLTTGLVGDRPRTLTPTHSDFAPFAWAWRQQNAWTTDEHREYWIAHLRRWPRARAASAELLAFALRAARARGLPDDDRRLEQLLGYDDAASVNRMLRRRHHGRRLDDLPELGAPVLSDHPLPWIWAPGEEPPSPHGYPAVTAAEAGVQPDPRAAAIAQRLAGLH